MITSWCPLPGKDRRTRFIKATDSRWLTLGTSSRTLVGSWSLGLPALVGMIRADKFTSDTFIKGSAYLPE
eukprot:3661700-Lingulodinium_polyedra.AAC.1